MKVYSNSGVHYINESLLNKIKENNPEILLEENSMDKNFFNNNIKKIKDIIINKFNYPLDDKQKDYIEHYLMDYAEKVSDKELEYKSDNFLDIQDEMFKENPDENFLEDIAYNILTNKNTPYMFKDFNKSQQDLSFVQNSDEKNNVVSIEDKLKKNIEKEIKQKASKKNGDTQSNDVRFTNFGLQEYINKKIKEIRSNGTQYKKEDLMDLKKSLNYMTNKQEIDKAIEFFKQNYDEKGFKGNITDKPEYNKKPYQLKQTPHETDVTPDVWDRAKNYIKQLQMFGQLTQQIVARSNHTITMTLNKFGFDREQVFKRAFALATKGYDYTPFFNVDENTTKKYYISALEVVDESMANIIKNAIFSSDNNPKIEPYSLEVDSKTRNEIKNQLLNGIKKCVYLFESIDEKDLSDMYNAILFDDILSNQFKINRLTKLSEYGFRDQIIYFTKDMNGKTYLISLFVFRKKLRKTRATFKYLKDKFNNFVNAAPKA